MLDLKTRILVVDDMASMRKIIIKTCNELGLNDIVEAGDGTQAWEQISSPSSNFGLVISDWNMPHCTGIELLKRIRGDQRLKATPFLLLNEEADKAKIIESVQAGVNGFLLKPFTPEALKEKLAAIGVLS